MGFTWKKSNNVREVLIERRSIVAWKGKYLKAIKFYRNQNRNIVYIDETWVDNTLCFGKCWRSKEKLGVLKNNSSSHRSIIVHAGGASGFVEGAKLIFKARNETGDYHGQMNADNFERYVHMTHLTWCPICFWHFFLIQTFLTGGSRKKFCRTLSWTMHLTIRFKQTSSSQNMPRKRQC